MDAGLATSVTLTDLAPGSYHAAVFAYDDGGLESAPSNEVTFSVEAGNVPPTVVLVAEGEPDTVALAWDANAEPDLGGYRVYRGVAGSGSYPDMVDVGNVTTAEVTVPIGDAYAFVVTAYNVDGDESAASAPVEYSGAQLLSAPVDIVLTASATDPDGSVQRVEFYEGANFLGQVTSEPFVFHWQGVLPGEFSVTARAVDDDGASTDSLPVLLSVAGDDEPPAFEGVPPDIATTPDLGLVTATVSWVEPAALDNVGVTVFGSSHLPGSIFPAGTTTVTYHAEDAAGNRTEVTFDVFVGSIDLWRGDAFGAAKDDPDVAGDLANPDGDRWSNLEEYVMGLDPLVADGVGIYRFSTGGPDYWFEFSRVANLPDVALVVESAPAPGGAWLPVATLAPGSGGWSLDTQGVSIDEVEKSGHRDVTVSGATSADSRVLRLTMVIGEP